jgi:superfamily II DNA/RNA helicase
MMCVPTRADTGAALKAHSSLTDTIPFSETTPAAADGPAQAEPHDPVTTAPPEPPVAEPPVAEAPAAEAPAAAPPAAEAAGPEPEPEGSFADLGLSEEIVRAVEEKGYRTPTPIQRQAIPWVLMGRDLLGCAQTGTGKTAGFTLPMLDILSGSRARARMPRSLILEPTRELALQVAENFVLYGKYLKLTHALIIGGESMSDQKDLLMRGVDVLIATPGRLIDMFERGGLLLTDAHLLVIDEADRMLDMGFIPDVERIVAMLPKTRQTLFFCATMAPEIRRLSDAFLENPKEITVSKPATVPTTVTEAMVMVAEHDKREALRRLIRSEDVQNALIFCNRKRDVDILYKSLNRHKFSVDAMHGDMAQSARFATMERFKTGLTRLLCCSDVAARGIDIGGLSHVFNFDVPIHAEDYVHRIGRTGRAGLEGRAFTLATPEDQQAVEAIERLTGHPIPRIDIAGLDTVDWAAGDGRRPRGRGRPAPRRAEAATGEQRKPVRRRAAAKAEAPAEDVAPAPTEAPPKVARPEKRVRAEAPAKPRPEAPPKRARTATPERAARPDPVRPDVARPPRARPEREGRPERDTRGRRDDDHGPSVLGFGSDTPAFMLITTRPRRLAEAVVEDTEA